MPNFNPKATQATLPPLPNDSYECVIGEPKAFKGANKEGVENYGVRYTLTVADGTLVGRKIFVTCYMHTEGAQAYSKQFLIAANNFTNDQEGEAAFDSSPAADLDYAYDADTNSCGAGWQELKGKRIIVETAIKDVNGKDQSQVKNYIPFNVAPVAQ
jgi:hypothetical protein